MPDRSLILDPLRIFALIGLFMAPIPVAAEQASADAAPALTLRVGPVAVSVPQSQGWTLAAPEPHWAAAMRSPRAGHTLDLTLVLHPVTDPWSAILLAKQPRAMVEPYLAALRDDMDNPEMPEVYFEAIAMRFANRHCLFFQSISDEGESPLAHGGTRMQRSIGAFCALPLHRAVVELRLIGIQPEPTDNYDALSMDMEAVFDSLTID